MVLGDGPLLGSGDPVRASLQDRAPALVAIGYIFRVGTLMMSVDEIGDAPAAVAEQMF